MSARPGEIHMRPGRSATGASPMRDRILTFLHSIAEKDPDGLGGVRTIKEIAEEMGVARATVRDHLEILEGLDKAESVGKMLSEPGEPVGWKVK